MLAGGVTRAFTYGLTGNVTLDDRGGAATTLTYNSMDRLVQVSAGAVTLVDYVYGADGQRAVKATTAATTHYLYDPGGALYAETDGAGTVLREYVTLGGVTLAVIDSGGVSYVHNDHLSTAQKMTDGATGAVVWDASYRPFGEVTVTTAAASLNQRFPGQYADAETGYSDNWNRTYDPSLGRYLQSDPIGLEGGLNTYGYVSGNPVGGIDPWGLTEHYGDLQSTYDALESARVGALNAIAGWQDSLTFGLAKHVREKFGYNADIDVCSDAYGAGELVGLVSGVARFAAGAPRAALKGQFRRVTGPGVNRDATVRAAYRGEHNVSGTHEVHHWLIPRRWGLPDSITNATWNLNPVEQSIHRRIRGAWDGEAKFWPGVGFFKGAPQWAYDSFTGAIGTASAVLSLGDDCGC